MNYADRVKDTSASVGQGPITLFGAPITGFRSFLSAFPSGAVDVPYAIDDGAGNWEIGIGSFSDSVLTRTQVLSSSSNGGLVDFVAGKKSVICTLPADLVESATNRSIAAASESAGHAEQTAQDRAQTAIDKAATAEDRIATAADREQTGMDASSASASASQAATSATAAAASASTATTQAGIATSKAEQAATSATAAATAQTASEQAAANATTQAGIATTQATDATAKVNLLGSADMVTATGTVALTDTSAVYQLIDPNGAARDVVLPALTAGDAGRSFAIKNTNTAGNFLIVKTAAGVRVGPALASGYTLFVLWTGTAWEAL